MDPSIGATLREARIRQGLDIADCVRATRIRARYLIAIEEGQLELLPDPAYVSGFVRAYANHLGVNLDGAFDAPTQEWPAQGAGMARPVRIDLAATRAPRRAGPRRGRGWLWALLVLAALAAALATAVWLGALDASSLPF